MSRNAIVVGSSVGIGQAVALELARRGWRLGLAGRNLEKMEEVRRLCGLSAQAEPLDATRPEESVRAFLRLAERLGGCDLAVVNAGVGFGNEDLEWEKDKPILDVNVEGFACLCGAAMRYFRARGAGHLVGVSSVAGLRGYGHAPAYNASKAFASTYLEGLRIKARRWGVPIAVTDIRPGFVATDMIKNRKDAFWVASAEEAARQIVDAIQAKKARAYVTRRWALIACLMRVLPDFLYDRL